MSQMAEFLYWVSKQKFLNFQFSEPQLWFEVGSECGDEGTFEHCHVMFDVTEEHMKHTNFEAHLCFIKKYL